MLLLKSNKAQQPSLLPVTNKHQNYPNISMFQILNFLQPWQPFWISLALHTSDGNEFSWKINSELIHEFFELIYKGKKKFMNLFWINSSELNNHQVSSQASCWFTFNLMYHNRYCCSWNVIYWSLFFLIFLFSEISCFISTIKATVFLFFFTSFLVAFEDYTAVFFFVL